MRRLLINGGKQPRELKLVGTMIIGRDPVCDVSEADPLLSRRHAEFVAGANDVLVRDLGSRNGILVNGVKRNRAVLSGGDVIQIGHLHVTFLDDTGPWQLDGDGLEPVSPSAEPVQARPHARPAVPLRELETPVLFARPSASPPTRRLAGPPPALSPAGVPVDVEKTIPSIQKPPARDLDRTQAAPQSHATPASPAPKELWETPLVEVQPFVGPGNLVRFDIPKRDWLVVSGGAATIVSLAQKNGQAAVVVERTMLDRGLPPGEITDQFAQLEADGVREHQPAAADIEARVVRLDRRRLVMVSYTRKGVAGPERVRQYSIRSGSDLYRITCSAALAQFVRYEPLFAHIAATFAIGTTP